MPARGPRSYVRGMTTPHDTLEQRPIGLHAADAGRNNRQVPGISWRSVGPDLAYLASGFVLTLFSFVLLLPLFVLGLSTAVLWVGLPILGFMLLVATWFARENRELLRRWGDPVLEPEYRWTARRRVLSMLLDAQAWRELLHGTLVTFPLRIVTFVVPVAWLGAALGGLTWFVWGIFLPREDYNGLTWLLVEGAGLDLGPNRYLAEAVTMFLSGLVLLVTAPLVARLCAGVDAAVGRVLIGGHPAVRSGGSIR